MKSHIETYSIAKLYSRRLAVALRLDDTQIISDLPKTIHDTPLLT